MPSHIFSLYRLVISKYKQQILCCLMFAVVGFAFAHPVKVLANPSVAKQVVPLPAPLTPSPIAAADGRILAPDILKIVNKGELVVAMRAADTPPFFYLKEGKLVGLEVDLATAIAKELKVPVRFDRTAASFNDVVDIVARGGADLGISKLSRTLARAQVISFSDPYLRLGHALILNRVRFAEYARNIPLPAAIRKFKGSIGVIANSSFVDYAQRNFPHAEVRQFATWEDVIKALESGQITAAYRDELEVKRVLKLNPTASLTMRTVTLKDLEDSLGIAVGIQAPVLLAFVNQFLAQSTEKLTVDKVLKFD
jgi:polar amino acid transport system substrate-binding protein